MTATNMNTFNSYQCGRNCKYFDLFSLIYWKTTSCFTIKYYKHGYNTAKRLKEYGEELLYFLTHPEIPYTNNECERRGRRLKSKMRVIGTFRSFQSAIDYLKFMNYMETERDTVGNKYEKLVEVFS